MNILDCVLTFSEASKIWGMDKSTLRKAVAKHRLKEGIDYKKSEGTYIITKTAMIREFGEPKQE